MPSLLGAAEIRRLAAVLDVTPTKKLGQNFVHDANTVRKIVALAQVSAGDAVLEIGPGLGSLTLGLLEAGARVLAVEIDGRLAARLPDTAAQFQPGTELTVIHSDALEVTELPFAPTHVVANLPYNVSVPVLLHLLETFPSLRSALVMVQAEVGYRIAAEPGSKVYGVPSIKAAWWGQWSVAGTVSRQVFWPVPNVDSVLVRFEQRPRIGDEALRERVFALVDAAFGQRRKMLRQSLASILGDSARATAALEAAGISPEARGEALSLDDFVRLAQSV
ncbi:MAG TPA: 16S rRNA (adenine(1518)-N(6)/adenine(1519)-N(6))-dimethyltransferase RsmA [Microbacteriaceae bacterium]|nr:16S rRNA (adenine(1518)-N(6)/adenine(1519)-N(6))-dimethyltransferase RsmA [Microbacteriaceae bacterium]